MKLQKTTYRAIKYFSLVRVKIRTKPHPFSVDAGFLYWEIRDQRNDEVLSLLYE